MAEQFDIVIAGAGHNSLITAAYLGKAGFSCLVLEARPVIGGNTMTEELTLPGFLHDTCSTTHAIFMQSPIWNNQELPLAEYGLEYIKADPVSHVVFPDGTSITQWMDIDRTCEEISRFSRHDAETYRKMISEWRSVSPIFNKIRYTPAGWDPSLALELAAHPQGAIWMRRQALSAWDIIDAAFEDWHVKSWMVWFAEGTVQPAERRKALHDPACLGVFAHVRLNEQLAVAQVQPGGQVDGSELARAVMQLLWVNRQRDGMEIDDTEDVVVLCLRLRPVAYRAQVVAQVQVARGLNA